MPKEPSSVAESTFYAPPNQLRIKVVVPLPNILNVLKGQVLWGTTPGEVIDTSPADLLLEPDGVLWDVARLVVIALRTA